MVRDFEEYIMVVWADVGKWVLGVLRVDMGVLALEPVVIWVELGWDKSIGQKHGQWPWRSFQTVPLVPIASLTV